MDGRFMGPGWHGGFGVGLLGIVFFALFIGLLIWALLRLMGHDHRIHHAPTAPMGAPWQPRDEALVAARMRYARGELDRDQYFRMVEDLTGVPRPPDAAPPSPFPPAPQPGTPDPA